MIKRRVIVWLATIMVMFGFLDTLYLSYNHFNSSIIICSEGIFGNCGEVLNSQYSTVFGFPLAVIGLIYYFIFGYLFWVALTLGGKLYKRLIFIQTALGLVFSAYLTFLQFFIIKSLCPYCLLSAIISLILYLLVRLLWRRDYRLFILTKIEFSYKVFAKPLFFLLPPEWVHEQAMFWGEIAGKIPLMRNFFKKVFYFEYPILKQKIAGITFDNPLGLSAGYDYMSAFSKILPSVGFGFETVGTISNYPFEGNARPRLGRLPKSKSLLVNKGFRNPGADATIDKLKNMSFEFPLGISIGKTNSIEFAGTKKAAVGDVVAAFKKFESAKLKNKYYELNISCPNLKGGVTFYPPEELNILLKSLKKLNISKPVFIKMPIEKSDEEVRKMLDVIVKYKFIVGVIFGNLQKDRSDKSFDQLEIKTAGIGNFSGKPTFRRSNELIKLAYSRYGNKLIVIGCGGIFTAEDAYRKIRLGASLVELITGMIFEGPQLISQINTKLVELLRKDGFEKLSDAVGIDS
ncbi:hypothetical protein COV58_02090 [Candidatus Roizmanbacteria bacterium CG11_big_fil_rev_8_21_14_0_20_36_8]|uniref:Dihydroorotate dehydrogenase (quinone) n=2 Tax=Candidatus Roizmaniibacteriota TaxID=1752723 RepID=A0A2M6IUG5_9BACT|nr:MAG: hypothetical protein COV58_02090 [Candidatus Roizmanbacteria bacterium CG11_big_fil_rev_8_21_14_0_20_36_8]PIZ65489.1 MAG: hypothetical protein COY14_02160 [Candidatus Roizmanbacteria bacterium CG_4_10_14_0_2_um_filter_36_9]